MEVSVIQSVASLDKMRCTGCGACVQSCPHNCISMAVNETGFLYPAIDSKCDNCGECMAACPVNHRNDMPRNPKDPQVYAAWSIDDEIRLNSTSGGIFTELAKVILSQAGYVVGARFDKSNLVEHAIIDKLENIPILRRSKYIQSNTKDIFSQVKEIISTKKNVLFVGTPCQCAGMTGFLNKTYENLFLCDFICRGVNSPMIYQTYLMEVEARYGSLVKEVWFKNKANGWNRFGTKIVFENGQEYFGSRDEDPFMHGYIKKGLNLYMRPSCGQCEFKGVHRPVDITLGDFWGVNLQKNCDVEKGVSAVMVHTEKGARLFESLQRNICYESKTVDDIIPYNTCLTDSAKVSGKSDLFYGLIKKDVPFSDAVFGV